MAALMGCRIYGISNCSTIRKARAWLDQHGVAHDFHDYRSEGVDRARLERWCAERGWESLLNRRGTTFRSLSDADKQVGNASQALRLMLARPALIRRPVLEWKGRLLVGFEPGEYQGVLRAK